MPVDVYGFLYAGAVAAGGLMGYVKARSIPSLAAGLTFGSLLALGAYQVSQNPSNYQLQLGTSCLLAGMMGYRYTKSGKIMPAGLVTVLSIAMVSKIVFANVLASPRKI